MKDKTPLKIAKAYTEMKKFSQENEMVVVPAGRFVDLAVLVLAYRSHVYNMLLNEKDKSPNTSRGMAMIRGYSDEIVSGMSSIMGPIAERQDAGSVKSAINRALRFTSPTEQAIDSWSDAIQAVMPWIKVRSELFNSLFSGRVTRAARELALVSEEENPPSILNKLATIAPVSGLMAPRKWIEIVAAEAGSPISATESVMADAQVAKNIGEDLSNIDASISSAHPNTPEAADLQDKKVQLLSQLDKMAETSSNPSVVLAIAAQAKPSDSHATAIGKKIGLTPDQEDAMMARGRVLIAAGAGSGKTRVLASKVAYHINELGVTSSSVMATSFTRKSSAELIKRCNDYGAVVSKTDDGFGTTHSIAGALLNKQAPSFKRPNYLGANEGWKQSTLFRLAMEQVKMGPLGIEPPAPKGMWDDYNPKPNNVAPIPVTPQNSGDTPSGSYSDNPADIAEFVVALRTALGYLSWAAKTWGGPRGNSAKEWLNFFGDLYDFGVAPSKMTPAQKEKFNDILGKLTKGGQPITDYRIPKTAAVHHHGFDLSATDVPSHGFNLYAEDTDAPVEQVVPTPRGKTDRMADNVYFKTPAKQWFNLGLKLTREGDDGKQVPIPMGMFRQVVSILKGKGISASEAWHNGVDGYLDPNEDSVAVYGAYEWLKGPSGEVQFQNTGDMDDLLIDAVAALRGSPTILRQVQSRFKVIMVDESQDLNRCQHLMFGLMAGYLDASTMKPWPDGHMTADTFSLIGDDKQCVHVDTPILTPHGDVKASDLMVGDVVLSYRNGLVKPQTVRHAAMSQWKSGITITTDGGKTLTMSPNHKIWASEPTTDDNGQVAVYLMYRRDMGFRVGVTCKGKGGKRGNDNYLYSYGGRAFCEKAEKMWILNVCDGREDALLQEERYSLLFGIPTMVFEAKKRGINQDRANALFLEFGENGRKLLGSRNLSFDLPHWMSQSYAQHGRDRRTVHVVAHSASGTHVRLEWSGNDLDETLAGEFKVSTRTIKNGDPVKRLRKWFNNYREAMVYAEYIASKTHACIRESLSTPEEPLRLTTASGLFIGMRVAVVGDDDCNDIITETITSIAEQSGEFVDLDIDDASNFFGGGILSHNSIFEFRGADPEEFISRSNLVENGGDFTTKLLDTNFRSGEEIVQAANNLIAHNKRQVPMVCKANKERNGTGSIVSRMAADEQSAAVSVASEIHDAVDSSTAGGLDYKDFGLALRSNAEAYQYGLEMLKMGIPFKSNARFFNDANTKALIGWMVIADKGLNGPADAVEEALRDCVKAPFSLMGPALFTRLEEKAKGSWAQWLVTDENWRKIYASGGKAARYYDAMEHFVNNLVAVSKMTGTPTEIVGQILELHGVDGVTTRQTMVSNVMEDDDVMAELAAASETGSVSQEQITEQAMAPIAPLLSLVKGKDELGPAVVYIQKLKNVNSKSTSSDTEKEIDRDAVTIGTMHSWKGLEVNTMYIPMVGGKFPRAGKDGKANPESPGLASERRLAYVAITRAEQKAVVIDIPNTKFGFSSQFIEEACIKPENNDAGSSLPRMATKWGGERLASMG